ncbi:hypothetical protein E9529_11525 [Blastococcus sp. KM273128]|uniref:hypothetical protein n=1 Tax=Blastococcus sp. KM273128 TaxID=2570314 RepID=UPI001F3F60E0|nr:hypothetical protein [Blastococcus sp. KM273128]MCF6744900.1 hypothetical protein [Blastococcus sp. KM273128]
MLFLPIDRGASVMLCNEVCLAAATVTGRLPAVEPVEYDASETCATCFTCEVTQPGHRCWCQEHDLSCSRLSWLLSGEAPAAVEVIVQVCGPTLLSDSDWDYLQGQGETVHIGGLVGLLWTRERYRNERR